MQVGFEKAGWQLIGIIPGFDRYSSTCTRVNCFAEGPNPSLEWIVHGTPPRGVWRYASHF